MHKNALDAPNFLVVLPELPGKGVEVLVVFDVEQELPLFLGGVQAVHVQHQMDRHRPNPVHVEVPRARSRGRSNLVGFLIDWILALLDPLGVLSRFQRI